MSLNEVMRMSSMSFGRWYQYIDIIQAENDLAGLNVSSYPHLNKKSKRDLVKSLKRRAVPNELDERKIYKLDEVNPTRM